MSYRITFLDWLLLAILVVCWGTSFAMSKVALQHVTPEWIAASRLFVGAAVLLAVTIAQGATLPLNRKFLAQYFWLGLIGNAAPFFLITWGMQSISSGVAGLLMGTIPLIIVIMAHFVLPGERITSWRAVGFVLGFAGIVVLMGPENLLNLKAHGQELVGELVVVIGCLMYGVNAISAKKFNLPGTIAVSAGVLAVGAVLATIAALLTSPFRIHGSAALCPSRHGGAWAFPHRACDGRVVQGGGAHQPHLHHHVKLPRAGFRFVLRGTFSG